MGTDKNIKTLVKNAKARHEYFMEETFEAGIELVGTEVKSLRQGKASLVDSFASIANGEVYIKNMHISPYEQGNIFNRDPRRDRKLLLHKTEIRRLIGAVKEKGYALIPISVYLKGPLVKISLALAKGKKSYDKREDAAKRDAARRIDRALKDSINRQ